MRLGPTVMFSHCLKINYTNLNSIFIMKKQYVLLLITLLFPLIAVGQNSIFPTNGDNVGIGTLAPTQRLNIVSTDSTSANMIRFNHNGINNSTLNIGTAPVNYSIVLQRKANVIESYTDLHLGAAYDGNIFFETARTGGFAPIRMTLANNGWLGIGTQDPSAKLHVDGGNIKLSASAGYPYGVNIDMDSPTPWAREFSFSTGATGKLFSFGVYGQGGDSLIYGYIGGNDTANNVYGKPWMVFRPNGNIGIGTTNPGSYKLAVEGVLGARKIKVTQGTWSDFVFDSDYTLMPLTAVDDFIRMKKHLPQVPSAAEVAEQGLDLGNINKILLQKIEELTLYMIQENKDKKALQQQVQQLSNELQQLKASLK
jgi:hypothetical protein